MAFSKTERLTKVETGVDELADYCQTFRQRLLDKQRVPAGVRAVPLRDASRTAVADACNKYLADDPHTRQDLLEHRLENGAFDDSPVLYAGDELAGFLLAHLDGTCGNVAARVVLPRYRGGWANIFLMAALADLRFTRPERVVSFEWRESNLDTAKLSQRFPSRVVGMRDRYARRDLK